MLLFLVTLCLLVVVQPFMEWISIKKTIQEKYYRLYRKPLVLKRQRKGRKVSVKKIKEIYKRKQDNATEIVLQIKKSRKKFILLKITKIFNKKSCLAFLYRNMYMYPCNHRNMSLDRKLLFWKTSILPLVILIEVVIRSFWH